MLPFYKINWIWVRVTHFLRIYVCSKGEMKSMYEDFQNNRSLMNCYQSQLEVVKVSFQAYY